jgi:hypothetical protein
VLGGIRALCVEVAVPGIAHKQTLAFQIKANSLARSPCSLSHFSIQICAWADNYVSALMLMPKWISGELPWDPI